MFGHPARPAGGFHPEAQLKQAGLLYGFWEAADPADGAVNPWTDRVSSLNVAQPTAANKPVRSAAGLNGFPVITSDGVDDAMSQTSFATLPTGSTPCEILALVDQQTPASSTTQTAAVNYGSTTADTSRRMLRTVSNGQNQLTASVTGTTVSDASTDFTGPHVVSTLFDGVTMRVFIDGRPGEPGLTTINALNTSTTRLAFFASNSLTPNNFWTGGIAVVAITAILPPFLRAQMHGWLAWRGGIAHLLPANHPFRFRRP